MSNQLNLLLISVYYYNIVIMKKRIITSVVLSLFGVGQLQAQVLPYQNVKLSFEQRVNDLVSRMTLEEKVSQMVDEAPAIPRLGIPEYNWWNECLHGVARAGLATVFPEPIGSAASFDAGLINRIGNATSNEARAKHNEFIRQGKHERYEGLTFWSPNINIFRDPRWGRGMETYGEDPYLTSTIIIWCTVAPNRSDIVLMQQQINMIFWILICLHLRHQYRRVRLFLS